MALTALALRVLTWSVAATILPAIGAAGLLTLSHSVRENTLAEQRPGAGRTSIIERHDAGRHGRILQHLVVGDFLDALQFVSADRFGMREVEAQPVWRNQ